MEIKVEAKSKYGILDANTNTWMNPDKSVPLSKFEIGKAYVVEIKENVSKGKTYKNIVTATEVAASAPLSKAVEAPKPEPKKDAPAQGSKPELSYDDKKSERILVQGVTQAVLQSPLLLDLKDLESTVLNVVDMVKKLSKSGDK